MTLLTLAVIVILAPACIGGAAIVFFGRRKKHAGPVGLLLHTLSSNKAPHCSYYPPDKFSAVLDRCSAEGFNFSTVGRIRGKDRDALEKTVVLTFDDGFESFYTVAMPLLEKHGFKTTVFPVAGYLGKPSSWDTLPPQMHLTKEQVREIASLGHEIGGHTVSHANLTLLNDRDLEEELKVSKKILEDCIGSAITSLSFPFGQWNSRVWDKAQALGYTAATSYAYRGNNIRGILPVYGIYSYDSVQDVWDRALDPPPYSNSRARGVVMPHFAKGTPLWKFRENYGLFR